MDPRISAPAQQFAVTANRVSKAIEGLDEAALLARPVDGANSMFWVLGHIAATRVGLLRMLGEDRPLAFDGRFGRGSEADGGFPPMEDVLALWAEVQETLPAKLATVSAEKLSEPSPREFPIEDQSLAGCVAFLAFHEAYHLGQLGYIRKCHDGQRLAG